ncbi:MAG: phosphoglycerate kinase [Candidatus Poribacteria bacterium]|nr:phosphoglycerate kinase [Candidatus Poribacteria bacterium]
MNKLTVRDLDVRGKRVFVRVDFNVPIDGGDIGDDTRIRAAVPTIELLRKNGGKVVLASHLGRPKGRDLKLSLKPTAQRLGELIGADVPLADDCIGDAAKSVVDTLKPGDVALLENVRFHPEEEANDPAFAKQLAANADVYVNDAFGTAHRAHASTVGVAELVSQAAAGLLMEKEIDYLGKAVHNPERPFYAILGGAKVSDKIAVITNLLDVADGILIGGGMAYTFLVAMGKEVGNSLVERDKVDIARDILIDSLQRRKPIYLPIDHMIADDFSPTANVRVVWRDTIPDGWEALDIGPATRVMYAQVLQRAKTVIWNGPLGVYEMEPFAHGTTEIAKTLGDLDATTIIGGGDCVAAVQNAGVADKMSHISTGGGASLEFLEGKELPGVAALTDKAK